MRRKSISKVLAAVMACAVAVSGCGGSGQTSGGSSAPAEPGATGAGEAGTAAGAAQEGSKTLKIGAASDIMTLDPHDQNQTNTGDLFISIGSQLFKRDLDFQVKGDLCTEYEQVDDLTWTFKIRDDASFSNGDPITIEDVKWSLDRVSSDEGLVAYIYFKYIDNVEIVDDATIKVTTESPRPDMTSLLCMPSSTILPSKFIEENGMEAYIKEPVSSGPYLLKEWIPDDHYTLTPNPDYYGEPATWEEVVVRAIPESSTRVSELLTGGVDLIYNVPVNEWERVSNNTDGYGTSLVYGETSRIMLMLLRMTDGWVCQDPLVREAIECAIDKNAICDTLLLGAGTPTRSRIGSSVVGFNNDLFGSEKGDMYDPERAKELLAQGGYSEGQIEVNMTASSGRYLMDAEMAQMIAAYLEAVGIKVNLELVDATVLSNMFSAKENKDLFLIGLSDGQYDGCYPLAQFCDPIRTEGQSDYDNPEIVKLYQQARVEKDPEKRAALSTQIQSIAAEDRPQVCIAQMKAIFGVSNRVVLNPRMDTNILPDEVSLAK
ncbi:MAG: ABC transporter substrate-binding protein [Lachnospiraceae bacterium]|nr:ABC transporter substrate-binding protein [Lachnospiraceae bacterium]MCI9184086.1 ABC transporter substrate-binding protein [Lachnospiraceae bacterium]